MTSTEPPVTASVTIDAPIEIVWQAITTPALIERWFLGVETETDWEVGGPIVHRGEYQGRPYVDKGVVLAFDPPRRLEHSHWSEASGLPDTPGSHQIVRWELTPTANGTELRIDETNLPSAAAADISERTWSMVLGNLRDLLEHP